MTEPLRKKVRDWGTAALPDGGVIRQGDTVLVPATFTQQAEVGGDLWLNVNGHAPIFVPPDMVIRPTEEVKSSANDVPE